MTTNTAQLIVLRDIVKAGDASSGNFNVRGWKGFHDTNAWLAYHGSLDAAKALHEAVRVGWIWGRQKNGAMWIAKGSKVFKSPPMMEPARGLLLCDIEALIAEADE